MALQSKILNGHTNPVWSVAFSPDGQILASGATDNTVRLWQVENGSNFETFVDPTGWVSNVVFSPDGQILASGDYDNTIYLWRVSDGSQLQAIKGPISTNTIRSVAFSPDGMILASGATDSAIRLWRVSDGVQINTLEGNTSWVDSVTFSPDGKILASGAQDGTIRLCGDTFNRKIPCYLKTRSSVFSWLSFFPLASCSLFSSLCCLFLIFSFLQGFLTFSSTTSSFTPNISSHFACTDSTPAPFSASYTACHCSSHITKRQSKKAWCWYAPS